MLPSDNNGSSKFAKPAALLEWDATVQLPSAMSAVLTLPVKFAFSFSISEVVRVRVIQFLP